MKPLYLCLRNSPIASPPLRGRGLKPRGPGPLGRRSRSPPLRGRGLKHPFPPQPIRRGRSPLLRGRGLKRQAAAADYAINVTSPPLRGRGLKRRHRRPIRRGPPRRPPPAGAWIETESLALAWEGGMNLQPRRCRTSVGEVAGGRSDGIESMPALGDGLATLEKVEVVGGGDDHRPGDPKGCRRARGDTRLASAGAERDVPARRNVLLLEPVRDRKLFTAPRFPSRSFTGSLSRFFTEDLGGKVSCKRRNYKRLQKRRGDREAEGAALEMPCTGNCTEGSNPSLSAPDIQVAAVST